MNKSKPKRIGRPPKAPHNKASRHLGIKLLPIEGLLLDAAVADEQTKNPAFVVNSTTHVKALILRDAEARGLRVVQDEHGVRVAKDVKKGKSVWEWLREKNLINLDDDS